MHLKANVINIAFAKPASVAATLPVTTTDVQAVQRAGTLVFASYGGWTYRDLWKAILDSDSQRASFVTAVVATISTYGLNGVDMDIECGDDTADWPKGSPAKVESVVSFFKELQAAVATAGAAAGKKLYVTFTVLTPSPAFFDLAIKEAHPYVDYIQVMAYNPYINPQVPGTEWPSPAKCDPTSPDPKPYDVLADFDRYVTDLGVPKNKLVLGMMPGCSDHHRCTSAADVVNRTTHITTEGYAGVMTWDVDRDVAKITGYTGSVSDLINKALAGAGDPAELGDLPTTCPPL
jgi:GH18 family chitinase